MPKIVHVASLDEFKGLVSSGVSVVDFFATWCGPCKMIAPKFEEFSDIYTSVKFLKVDVDEVEEVAAEAGVSAMPTFQLFKNGAKVDELVGASVEKLEALIKKYA